MPKRTTLVPVSVREDVTLPSVVYDLVGSLRVVLLGTYQVPEQTPPEQARENFEEVARERLEALAEGFSDRGTEVEPLLVFTPDRAETVDRVTVERECGSVLFPGVAESLERVLVPVRSETNLERILEVVARIANGTTTTITLFHVSGEDEEEGEADLLLRGARARLVSAGVPPGSIDLRTERSEEPIATILAATEEADAVVIGETKPSLRTMVFGDVPMRIVEEALCPVIVVRRD
ncbi:universal stress protein [Natronorarus salvus]|uniref:universal stress protein n=1 Tax=Natronorarus salvus TaxID=3117733 RepID=UPI002F26C45E